MCCKCIPFNVPISNPLCISMCTCNMVFFSLRTFLLHESLTELSVQPPVSTPVISVLLLNKKYIPERQHMSLKSDITQRAAPPPPPRSHHGPQPHTEKHSEKWNSINLLIRRLMNKLNLPVNSPVGSNAQVVFVSARNVISELRYAGTANERLVY